MKPYLLTISAKGNPRRRQIADLIVERAPELAGVYKIHAPTGASVGNRVSWRPELVCPNWTGSAHPLRSVVVQAEKRAAAEADPCGLRKWRCGSGAGPSCAGKLPLFFGIGPFFP